MDMTSLWRCGPQVPIAISTGLSGRATHFYKSFLDWTNESTRKSFETRNAFDFRHIRVVDEYDSSATHSHTHTCHLSETRFRPVA